MSKRVGTILIPAGFIIAVVFAIYYPVIDNYFTWDDFVWLQKAKSLPLTPSQIFNIDVVYFDPLIHLSFWLDYTIAALDYRWYHLVDLLIHSLNGLLVFLVAETYCRDRSAALYSALIFVSTFATVDAVAWSSSRVDLFATLFSLATLLLFIRFRQESRRSLLAASAVCFTVALSAKGTPIVLPVILLCFLLQEKAPLRDYRYLLPHALIAGSYLILLKLTLIAQGKPLAATGLHPNLHNLKLALASLFIPEAKLAATDPTLASLIIAGLLFGSLLIKLPDAYERMKRLGLTLLIAGVAPVLILKDFNLASSLENAGYLLTSPSHRLYLASTGMALMFGALLAGLTQQIMSRRRLCLGIIILTPLLAWNLYEVRQREKLWHGSAETTRNFVEGFQPHRTSLQSNSLVALINPPISRGFTGPALDVLYNVNNLTLLPINSIPEQIIDSPDIFRFLNRCSLFAYGQGRLTNLSDSFNSLVQISFAHASSNNPAERERLLAAYTAKTGLLNAGIKARE